MRPHAAREPRFEVAGGQRLPLGGIIGFIGVRGKQGKKKNMFLGLAPMMTLRSPLFDTALEGAFALAQLREVLVLGILVLAALVEAPPASIAVALPPVLGGAPGALLQRPRAGVPQVGAVLLSPQHAAAAAARGVAMSVVVFLLELPCALARLRARNARLGERARARTRVRNSLCAYRTT